MDNKKPRSPIQILEHNITNHFESITDSSKSILIESINKNKIKPYIKYLIGGNNIQSPFVLCEEKAIQIQERYISFLWAFIYSNWVKFEEGEMKNERNINYKEHNKIDLYIVKRADVLFNWTVLQSHQNIDWNTNLPNPMIYHSTQEKTYGEKVNKLFLDAITLLMFHEVSHLINGHCEEIIKIKNQYDTINEEDREFINNCEKDADNYAFDIIMNGEFNESERLLKGISVLMAFSNSLFIIKTPTELKQFRHPDLDLRLSHMIESVGLTDPKNEYYLYKLGCMILDRFMEKHKEVFEIFQIFKPSEPVETAKDLFYAYLDKIEMVK